MSVLAIVALAALCLGLGVLLWRESRGRRQMTPSPRRILLPIAGSRMSERALDAALRLARAEQATLAPAYLVRVAMSLPLETPLPRSCETAMPMLEAIEHRASSYGVPVDARIVPGRTLRHAVTRLFDGERFDRVVVTAGARSSDFSGEDVAWLLEEAPTEVVVVRPRGDVRPAAARPARRAAARSRSGHARTPAGIGRSGSASARPALRSRAPSA
ncbi:MAG: universal stress protein [Actinobacteria bacterium]|nr:universal stress protein [Actinomycetota bacterium]